MAIETWDWEITRRCNLSCLHCILGGGNNIPEMSTLEGTRAIDRIVLLGGKTLKITGGEPTVRSDLMAIIDYAVHSDLAVEIITNGTLVTQDQLASIARQVSRVELSIEGLPEVHDKLRGNGSYAKVCKVADYLLKHDVEVAVSLTVTALNIGLLVESFQRMVDLGIRQFHINGLNLEGNAKRNEKLLDTPMESAVLAEVIISSLEKVIEIDRTCVDSENDCTIKSSLLYMSSIGDVFPCVELCLRDPAGKIGNIFDDGFFGKVTCYYDCTKPPPRCRYVTYSSSGFLILLDNHCACPLNKGGI